MAGLHVVEEEMPVWDVNSTNQEEEEHPASRRFVRVSEQDVDKIIEEQENESTKRKTAYDINLVVKFMSEEQKEKRELENISPEELNNYLSKFIVAARTKHGKEYEPTSLRGILSSVERYLGRKNYGKRIFIDAEFKKLRETLKAKQKQLKKKGLGNKPRATTALTEGEIEILFEKKILGTSSPQALLNLVWLNNIMHFGLRGCKEQRDLKWGDVILKADSEGKEYLEYSERQTKTRTGEDPRNVRQVKPRMYENKAAVVSERDPLHVYKEYRNNRPESMMEPETPFYLSVNYFKTASFNCVWFKSQPMGINKLNTIMKEMCKAAGIAQKTNHCGRKTMVQKLQDNGVPPNQIVQITGHKNLQSINNYSSLRERQQENISNILSSANTPPSENRPALPFSQTAASSYHSYQATSSSTSSVNENRLQTMFHGNTITGGTFNINLASTHAQRSSPDSGPSKCKLRRLKCIESDSSASSQES